MDAHRPAKRRVQTPQDTSRNLDGGSNANGTNGEKPLFILHVGPPKTGTTTIQWYAANHEKLLQKHNIHYLGHYGKHEHQKIHPLSYACKQQKKGECKQAWKKLESTIEKHYQEGHNLFMSEEIFSNYNDKQHENQYLFKYLVPMLKKWNVRIVLGYRRFYEWAPSWYAQLNQPTKINRLKKWPHEGGRAIPTFAEYMEKETADSFQQMSVLKKKWQNHFPNDKVWIFNMHDASNHENAEHVGAHVLFFCQMIPEAPSLCKFVKNEEETTTKNLSSSKGLHLDMMVMEAYNRKWIPYKDLKISRASARMELSKHAKKLGHSQPSDFGKMKCPTKKQLDQLLDWSVQMEKEMVPDFFASANGHEDLKKQFQKALEQYSLCSIDAQDALRDEKKWKGFFESLAKKKPRLRTKK